VAPDSVLDVAALRPAVLAWGRERLRDLPWRQTRDPWAVLVSEFMLQQTQVARVVDRYGPFLDRFPDARACAASPASAIIEHWQGLGYNRRAINLHRASQAITADHAGSVPDALEALVSLPGVGPYTARAVLVFAFERDVGVVDVNVARLMARWDGTERTPQARQRRADELVPLGGGVDLDSDAVRSRGHGLSCRRAAVRRVSGA
jgi:A/G-specific adenine glycosylase